MLFLYTRDDASFNMKEYYFGQRFKRPRTGLERGVNPKSLQKILGHAQLSTTMDTYVHVTDDSLLLAIKQFEAADRP